MLFELTHRFFPVTAGGIETFTHDDPPWWLVSSEFKWFYHAHVLTLDVGESKDTDFRKITRIK